MEQLTREYAEKFSIDIDRLKWEIEKHNKIGNEMMPDINTLLDRVFIHWSQWDSLVTFETICECVSVHKDTDGFHYYVFSGDKKIIQEYLLQLKYKRPEAFNKILTYTLEVQPFFNTYRALMNIAEAYIYLQNHGAVN